MTPHASIDIGTNSTRLLIAEIAADRRVQPVYYQERLTKLGAGLQADGTLTPESMQRVLEALTSYKRMISEYHAAPVFVFATSATRDARNRREFLELIRAQTGWRCRVLTGEEEARLSFLGVVSDLNIPNHGVVCDVGGGSSEFIFAQQQQMSRVSSLNVGSNRLSRQFLRTDPPSANEIRRARHHIRDCLDTLRMPEEPISRLVAVGGTASSLALMDSNIPIQQPQAAHHYELNSDRLEHLIKKLGGKTHAERQTLVGLNPQRADVILGGALIFSEILQKMQHSYMVISLRDLLFGIFLEQEYDRDPTAKAL